MKATLPDLLQWTSGRVVNADAVGDRMTRVCVTRPSSLAGSTTEDVAFFFSRAFEHELPLAQPGILIIGEPFVGPLQKSGLPIWKNSVIIASKDPYLAMAIVSEKFAESRPEQAHISLPRKGGVHPTAVISPDAQVAENVEIGAGSVIGKNVKLHPGVVIYPGCVIGDECEIGEGTVLFPRVVLYEGTQVGKRVRLHSGTVLGSDGFGYSPVIQGKKVAGHQKIYHLGRVIVEDEVEIGANSCVDRGTFGDTRIGKNSKLDNLVHIGHNALLEEGVIICGGTCLAGNARIGKFAVIGGLTGITNHVYVGERAQVGALALVTKDVQAGDTAVGNPQRDYKEHFRAHALLSRLLKQRRSE